MATTTVELTKSQKKLKKDFEKEIKAKGFALTDRTPDAEVLSESGEIKLSAEPDEKTEKYIVTIPGVDPPAADNSNTTDARKPPKIIPTMQQMCSGADVEAGKAAPIVTQKRGGKRGEVYPFGQMALGDSFVIPASEEVPIPWKSFASTVSTASRRHKDKGMRFAIRHVTAGEKYDNGYVELVTGARVYRVK